MNSSFSFNRGATNPDCNLRGVRCIGIILASRRSSNSFKAASIAAANTFARFKGIACGYTDPGAEIGVRFTCKEKIDQEKKSEEDIAKGIVKWLVDVYDETGETVAIATILTMVKKKNQD